MEGLDAMAGSQIIGEYGGEDSEKYSSLGYILKAEPIEPY